MCSSRSISMKRLVVLLLVGLAIFATIQVEPIEAFRSDLIFVKGKFIKKDRRGVTVVEEKPRYECHGRRRR